jgi:glycosyltransferase involved in cell wall biosynthesis
VTQICIFARPPLGIIGENSMLANKKVTVVLPAYNAAQTLKQTFNEIPHDIVDDIILIDDASHDATVEMARNLGIPTIRHDHNRGYGGNQKTCYTVALARGADIVVMLHPDYQYTPKLVTAMASMIASGEFDVVLGSRILGRGALVGGMPIYKYISEPSFELVRKPHHRSEAIRISYWVSGMEPGGARAAAAPPQFGRFRIR